MAWRSCFLQASFNYERMQSAGWLYSILPGLEKIHADNKEDLALSMTHNMEFFNIHPFLVTFAMGIILSMEQKKVDIPTIRAVRVSLMGPLGGIGDAIFWMTLVPITGRHHLEHGYRRQHLWPHPVPDRLQHHPVRASLWSHELVLQDGHERA
jgi:mannose/fructose/N-acetylgalactosamine-specific phosphotransferase system component IID